jgi:uncharacterized Zn finger protein
MGGGRKISLYTIKCMDCQFDGFEVVFLLELDELCVRCSKCGKLWSIKTLASIKIKLDEATGHLMIDKTSYN